MNGPAGFLRRLGATTLARSLEFVRDRATLGWNLALPISLVIGLAYIFSGPGQPQFKVAVLAPAGVTLDATLHPFLGTRQILFYRESEPDAAIARVQSQRSDMLLDLRAPPGRYYVNEQSPKGYLLERLLRGSGGAELARAAAPGTALRYVDWAVPGVLGMNMMFSCLFGLGHVIVRYRKNGYLKRLNATPLRAVEFLLAQLLSRLVLAVGVTAGVFAGCNLFLHFRVEGSYALLFLTTVLGAFSMIAMGLVVTARVTSEELSGGILNLLSWPMMVISGVFFSMEGAPRPILIAADFFPLTHLLRAARAIMLDGAGVDQIAGSLGVLALMSLVFLGAGAALFRWRQD
jgi:ABC-type multidrug transport system permease subunit